MPKKLQFILPLLAGLLGGILTRYIAPPVALAQTPPAVTKEVRAQSFTLVSPNDQTAGTFTAEPVPGMGGRVIIHNRGLPNQTTETIRPMRIVLRDPQGNELWSAGGSGIRPAYER
ncbi:MAG TPA: hypothetical protein VG273_07725 [Bryobacteraceae bacterium]|nr:hypothetical protein [Bryobacteraceae bacterium]